LIFEVAETRRMRFGRLTVKNSVAREFDLKWQIEADDVDQTILDLDHAPHAAEEVTLEEDHAQHLTVHATRLKSKICHLDSAGLI